MEKVLKKINELEEKLDKILKVIDNGILTKARQCEELKQRLKELDVKVETKLKFDTNIGEKVLEVKYSSPTITIIPNEYNHQFYLWNILDVLSTEQFVELSKELQKIRKE